MTGTTWDSFQDMTAGNGKIDWSYQAISEPPTAPINGMAMFGGVAYVMASN